MFVIYEMDGGEYWLARSASRVPAGGRYLGVVELEEAEPLLSAVLDRWNADGWREVLPGFLR